MLCLSDDAQANVITADTLFPSGRFLLQRRRNGQAECVGSFVGDFYGVVSRGRQNVWQQ